MTDLITPVTDLGPLDRAEPHDITAEQNILGACMISRDAARLAVHSLAPADFYRPAHEFVLAAVAELLEAEAPVEIVTVVAQLQTRGHLARCGGWEYVHQLAHDVATAASTGWYIARVRECAQRRAIIRTGTRMAQMGYDPGTNPGDIAEHAVAMARDVRDAGRAAEDSPVQTMHQFLASVDDTYDWVLPGYLERTDRLVLTGGEGGGKSVLLRQMAITAAAGLLPFGDDNAYGPARVLILDCENSDRQTARAYRNLMNTAERLHRGVRPDNIHIDIRPQGVDLTRAEGRAWLMRRVEAVMPQMLVIGPLYRMHVGDPNSEEHARRVSVVLDEARATASCALVVETHAAKGNGFGPRSLAPVGSSLWLRWPEFGYGLRPVEDARSADQDRARRFVPWRGARDERDWPSFLRQGAPGAWPWIPYTPIDADPFTGRSETGATS